MDGVNDKCGRILRSIVQNCSYMILLPRNKNNSKINHYSSFLPFNFSASDLLTQLNQRLFGRSVKGENFVRRAYDSVFSKQETKKLNDFLTLLPDKVPVPANTIPSQYLLIDVEQSNLLCGLLPYEVLRIFTQ